MALLSSKSRPYRAEFRTRKLGGYSTAEGAALAYARAASYHKRYPCSSERTCTCAFPWLVSGVDGEAQEGATAVVACVEIAEIAETAEVQTEEDVQAEAEARAAAAAAAEAEAEAEARAEAEAAEAAEAHQGLLGLTAAAPDVDDAMFISSDPAAATSSSTAFVAATPEPIATIEPMAATEPMAANEPMAATAVAVHYELAPTEPPPPAD